LWLHGVAERRNLDIALRLVCLAMLDARRGVGRVPSHRAALAFANVIMAARLELGREAAWPLFLALGKRVHDAGRSIAAEAQAILVESLDELGFSLDLIALASLPGTGAALLAEHDHALALVGDDLGGSPILAVDQRAFFGPVISSPPPPDRADSLFDALVTAATCPEFCELKGARS
jgi:hypothetical protein